MFRKKLNEVQSNTDSEKEWWEKRRASIQSEFMKELDEEAQAKASKIASPAKSTSDEDAILVDGPSASEHGSPSRKKKARQ